MYYECVGVPPSDHLAFKTVAKCEEIKFRRQDIQVLLLAGAFTEEVIRTNHV